VSSQWAVLQLREHGDGVRVADLDGDLRARCPPPLIARFPAVRSGWLDRTNPLSLYVFVQTPASLTLEASPYAARYLRIPGTTRLQLVTEAELAAMAVPPLLPPCGSVVRVTTGDWSDMEGVVVAQNCSKVSVLLELWSKRAVIDLTPADLQLL
jgi:hypothetical protein